MIYSEITVQLSTLYFRNQTVVITDASGNIFRSRTSHDIPHTFSQLRKQYLNCNRNSAFINSKKVIGYVLVMLLSYPIFFLKNAINAKKFTLTISQESMTLPLTLSMEHDTRKFWVSREAVKNGIRASSLASHLEIELVNLTTLYSGWVWGILLTQASVETSTFKSHELELAVLEPAKSSASQILFTDQKAKISFGVSKLQNASVVHGKFVVKCDEIYPVDFRQFQPTRYSVADVEVDLEINKIKIISPISAKRKLQSAIFVGSHSNYFHFIYECLTRLIYIQEIPNAPSQIVVSAELPETLIVLLEKYFGLECILVDYYEELIVEDLWLGFTQESPGLMKIDGRAESLKMIRNQIENSMEVEDSLDYKPNIFVRRPFKSTRPLQNRLLLILIAILNGFKIVSPEKLDITDQIRVFKNANRIIGEEGAALTNLLFIKANSKVLELQEPLMHSKNLFRDYSMLKPDSYALEIGTPCKFGESGFSRDGFIINPFRVIKWILLTKKEKR